MTEEKINLMRMRAAIDEIEQQRNILGTRCVNMAADYAVKLAELNQKAADLAAEVKKLQEETKAKEVSQ